MNCQPLISIITVAYNAVSTIEETILSVINQTYPNIEYIIIDGGSTDGTIDIINKYEDKITYWISEPDKGIYDAMNKGIDKATGEWINFMNCGDTFYSNTTIDDVFKKANLKSDIIYGNTNLLYSVGNYIKSGDKVSDINYMPFCHQSSFVKTIFMKEYNFDLQYKICADKNFFRIMYKTNKSFEYVDIIISNYDANFGISSTNYKQLIHEIGLIEEKNNTWKWKLYKTYFTIQCSIKNFAKKFIPNCIVEKIKREQIEKFISK